MALMTLRTTTTRRNWAKEDLESAKQRKVWSHDNHREHSRKFCRFHSVISKIGFPNHAFSQAYSNTFNRVNAFLQPCYPNFEYKYTLTSNTDPHFNSAVRINSSTSTIRAITLIGSKERPSFSTQRPIYETVTNLHVFSLLADRLTLCFGQK